MTRQTQKNEVPLRTYRKAQGTFCLRKTISAARSFFLVFLWFAGAHTVCAQGIDTAAVNSRLDSMLSQVNTLRKSGNMAEACPLARETARLAEEQLGRQNLRYAAAINLIGICHVNKSEYAEAEVLFSQVLAIRKQILGPNNLEVAGATVNTGLVCRYTRRYAEAERLLLEAKEIFENGIKNTDHQFYSTCLYHLAEVYFESAQYGKAIPVYELRLQYAEKRGAGDTEEYASIQSFLGDCYNLVGQDTAALKWYQQAKLNFESLGSQGSEVYLHTMERIAILFANQRDYVQADTGFRIAMGLHAQFLGPESGDVGRIGVMYGRTLWEWGRLAAAEVQLKQAVEILEDVYGTHTGMYGEAANILGMVYDETFRFDSAEVWYLRALKAHEASKGKSSRDYVMVLDNLSNTYSNLGIYEKSIAIKEEAVSIMRKVAKPGDADFIRMLLNLANSYLDLPQPDQAAMLIREVEKMQLETPQTDPVNVCYLPQVLGSFSRVSGEYAPSAEYTKMALDSIKKYFGGSHPKYFYNLVDLIETELLLRNSEMAVEHINEYRSSSGLGKDNKDPNHLRFLDVYIKYLFMVNRQGEIPPVLDEYGAILNTLIQNGTAFLSEKELTETYADIQRNNDKLFSYTLSADPQWRASMPERCMNQTLFNKSFLLNAGMQLRNLAIADSVTAHLFDDLQLARKHLAAQYARPVSERQPTAELENRIELLEKELARKVPALQEALRAIDWQAVQNKLTEGSAVIEYVQFRHHTVLPTDSVFYVALVVRPGMTTPLFIPLFEEKQLDSLLHTTGSRRADYVHQLYALANRGAKPLDRPRKTLYELLWQPLEPHLQGVKTIYFAPSGLVHRLNLSAIPLSPDSVLADRYQLVQLGSTRQLVVPTGITPAQNDAILFGGIRYEADTTALASAGIAPDNGAITSRGGINFAYTDSTSRGGAWNYLPFTEKEVKALSSILQKNGVQIETRSGHQATEESFKSIGAHKKPSPKVLHIATHGYFFPDPERKRSEAEPVFKMSDHPMIRSGLLLAGANHTWQTGKPLKPGMEDGILTAYEISQMNLSNTELVVLSACETGLGDIQGNEGVYGLQRAFKIAGAKYLIMSLWQVPDQQTSLLMTTFYKKWLEEKMPIPEALQAAQQVLREAGLDPFYWAGFVLVE